MKVIVIDDEPVIADTLVDILRGEGHQAFALSSGAAAVEWAKLIDPNVVISDVIMPGMNGIDVAKQIIVLFPNCKIILFSGQAASVDLAAQAGAEGFEFEILPKPIDPTVLIAAVGR